MFGAGKQTDFGNKETEFQFPFFILDSTKYCKPCPIYKRRAYEAF